MNEEHITRDMKIADILKRYPQTFEVFRSHGCPDMRTGVFALSARIMKLKWAAWFHKIPVNDFVRDLNAAVNSNTE